MMKTDRDIEQRVSDKSNKKKQDMEQKTVTYLGGLSQVLSEQTTFVLWKVLWKKVSTLIFRAKKTYP
jgi:hypothetical protein